MFQGRPELSTLSPHDLPLFVFFSVSIERVFLYRFIVLANLKKTPEEKFACTLGRCIIQCNRGFLCKRWFFYHVCGLTLQG